MVETILLIDDEPAILQGYQRLLRREFQIETAVGSAEALAKFEQQAFAVVVSDMQMPGMDGVHLLAKIKNGWPDSIRIMLTGNADVETAVNAVNDGNIFRFLTKPCSHDLLARTLTAALLQFRLVTAERELLEKTLSGSIEVLTEVLSLVNPAAFSRAMRLRRYIRHIVANMGLPNPWRFEVAAMMSQLGCVTLHPETIEAVYAGQSVSPDEQARFDTHPEVGGKLLSHIPRMEPIAWMIMNQRDCAAPDTDFGESALVDTVRVGTEILRMTLAFDEHMAKGDAKTDAISDLHLRWPKADPRIFQALSEIDAEANQKTVRTCSIEHLTTGMVLNEEIRTQNDILIVARGQEVTYPLIVKLKNFYEKQAIKGTVSVAVARVASAAMA